MVVTAASILVAGAVVIAIVLGGGAPGIVSAEPSEDPIVPIDAAPEADVPAPVNLTGASGPDGIVFTWNNPSPEEGDVYLWQTVVAGEEGTVASVKDPTVTVKANAAGQTCVEVSIRREDGRSSTEPATGCLP